MGLIQNRFKTLIAWAEGQHTTDGDLAASLLRDLWADVRDSLDPVARDGEEITVEDESEEGDGSCTQ